MVRDENDRPYEDGQARSLNPELTGDVLSPRWSTDDTDEQPAIQVTGNETYILPPDQGATLPPEAGHDVLDDLPARPAGDLLGQGQQAEESPYLPLDRGYDGEYQPERQVDALAEYEPDHPSGHPSDHLGDDDRAAAAGPAGDDRPASARDSYDAYDSYDDDQPRRGFLGSGWTDDSGDERSGRSEREVRRRTRTLVMAAVAVVLIGVGAGFVLTGTSSDDPCAAGRCASAGEVTAPSEEAAVPEETPQEEETEPTDEPTAGPTAGPGETAAADPTPAARQPRPTREPAARPTRTRSEEPAEKTSARPSRSQEPEPSGTDEEPTTVRDSQTEQQRTADEQPTEEASATQAPDPAPTQEERKGLLDFLFPWA
ncbi:hypothetical protein MF672_027415 [Actinomadura sp. ATCC 31491]|uniref:Uncharacterized protein n=1 Tax=Actinomadura luzonensis TaxID=2805427 RepID=A0ABT0FYR8_9ACTN|nr:hypothetical protein [Actinomadura luzonensis]MCK2217491.1 hypothetical protein [Actinomadura luzonensis]